ncbi:MAG: sugar phosphorylase [Salinivirgaceae bacterium]|jgi:sucrose phosphorylase|nr:sugar phosphorylase [Salinivirgaceae bacterium]
MKVSENWKELIITRLRNIYNDTISDSQIENFVNYIKENRSETNFNEELWKERDIALITYGDSILESDTLPLQSLNKFAKNHLNNLINIIHILPFFPFSSDDGFSVIDFEKVNPDLGSWDDIKSISDNNKLMADLVINHVSSKSNWFKNYLQNKGEGVDYFIEESLETDLSKVTRPRSSSLLTTYNTINGPKHIWTTFSDDQIDLNFANPAVLLRFLKILHTYIKNGAKIIRLDAIAFLWKEVGTTCLHLQQTHEVVKLLRDFAGWVGSGVIILTETNVPNKENLSYFGHNDEAHMVYQFSLPPLLLHALNSGNGQYLTQWASTLPKLPKQCTFFNFTSSHDGIGVRPLEGLLPDSEKKQLYSDIKASGGLISMKSNTKGSESPYELNITYFDAMKRTHNGEDGLQELRFISSQAVMLAMKGLPAFYIHSLLGSANYYKGVENTGRARTINREKIQMTDLERDLKSNTSRMRVFTALLKLITIRKNYQAFHPSSLQTILDLSNSVFAFVREASNGESILAINNLTSKNIQVEISGTYSHLKYDIITEASINVKGLSIKPYQTLWLIKK